MQWLRGSRNSGKQNNDDMAGSPVLGVDGNARLTPPPRTFLRFSHFYALIVSINEALLCATPVYCKALRGNKSQITLPF